MIDGSSEGYYRRGSWRIGRLVCGVAAIIPVLAGVAAVALAQLPPTAPVTANPPLAARCGLKVQLVLDESGSIVSPTDEATKVRGAARAFVNALAGTGSSLAITAFQRTARQLIGYTPVTRGNENTFFSWINGRNPPSGQPGQPLGYNPEAPPVAGTGGLVPGTAVINATNWDDALKQALDTGAPQLVVFITDGDPTTYNLDPNVRPPVGTNTGTQTPATSGTNFNNSLINAVPPANAVKVAGSRIFAVGVGPAAGTGTAAQNSRERLQKISGPTELTADEGNFVESDWTALPFAQLQEKLTGIVADLCAPSLTITKHVLDHNGDPVENAPGWRFETTLSGGGHTWVNPEHATDNTATGPTASLTTGADGIARFEWNSGHQLDVAPQHFEKEGFTFEGAQCTIHHAGETTTETDPIGMPKLSLGPEDYATCQVTNKQHAANLTVVKRLEPSDDPGEFNLLVNGVVRRGAVGDQGSTGPITLPLGTHEVSETAAPGTSLADYDTSIECVNLANDQTVVPEHIGTSVSVHLTSNGQNVVCTITNVSTKFGQLTVIKHLIPDTDSGRFNLLVNGSPPNSRSESVGDGGSTGPIRLPFGPHEVTEEPANAGTMLDHYNIGTTCIDENTGHEVAHNARGPSVSVDLSREHDSIQCTITNERPAARVARLEVIKHLVPHDDAARFDLLIGGKAFAVGIGHNGTTGPLEFELGKYAVIEHAARSTDLADFSISATCIDKGHGGHTVAQNSHGPSVSVDLNRESDNIVCTITNKRTAAPGGGGGEVPTPPGPDPHLSVVKTMPPQSRVRELVPITITVHNFGHGTAHGVQLHENPSSGMRIVRVANGGTIQHGVAVWHLGDLKHGESRTVDATARVLHTGLHVDTAVATALNSDPALSQAAVRARAARRRRHPHHPKHPTPPPPHVTG
jgi:hypothetical protein